LSDSRARILRQQAELEAANQVLQHRTEALISLESIGQALGASPSLGELAARLCRHARDLCGADRSILYHVDPQRRKAEVLAESGWGPTVLHRPIDAELVIGGHTNPEPVAASHWPPGVPQHATDVTARALRAGLRIPLMTGEGHVGLMMVHTSQKARFTPGEIALLQTFASQAAVAIERASLLEALQEKLAQLRAAQAELVQKKLMEQELQLARQVQLSVLPSVFPRVPGYLFAAQSLPARWVGGDFYDLLQLDRGRLGIAIGDVSGKGMPAALFVAQVHSLLVAEAHRERSPLKVLANVHRLLQSLGRSRMFVTVFYGIVEIEGDQLTYARAGHDKPLLLRQGRIEALEGEGTVLGFSDMEDLYLSEEQILLQDGDSLVLYTDGLADALSPAGQRLGLRELISLVQAHSGLPAEELVKATFANVLAHQGSAEQFDDMSMLVVSLTGAPSMKAIAEE
jgi:serine phosphatase RsbU (regulator of sigma subunit)